MDCIEITEGATLFLPVNVKGALLAMGDCHAAMGDGEISVCGAEVPGQVSVKIKVIKSKDWPTPFIIHKGNISAISSKKTLDEASVQATKNMVKFVQAYSDLSPGDSTHLLSFAGNLKICQIVDPNKTARMELPLYYLSKWEETEEWS